MEHGLAKREFEIVRLLRLGCSVKKTAKLLELAPSTVDNYQSRVKRDAITMAKVLVVGSLAEESVAA